MRIPNAVVLWVVAAVGLLGTGLASAAVLSGADGSGAPADEPDTPGDDQGEDASGVPRFYDGCGDFTSGTHGDYVSKIARDPNSTADDVRAAAHSDCGKPLSAAHQPPVTEGAPAAETSPPSHPSSPHTGPGHGPSTAPGHGPGGDARDRGAGRGRH